MLVAGSALGLHYWFQRRRDRTSRSDRDNWAWTETKDWPLTEDDWAMVDVQFMADDERIRAVVTIDVRDGDADRRRTALQIIAREIYRRTEVEAVFVEARRADELPDLYLLAADGRGWWGREHLGTALTGRDFGTKKNL